MLWRTQTPGTLHQLTYAAAQGVTVSDHRPVSAAFALSAKEYSRDQIEASLEVARRVADAQEMASTPHCTLTPTQVGQHHC